MYRKKVLLVNESSTCLNTGFSIIGKELLSRLYALDKYDLFELATYSSSDDPRHLSVPWTVFGGIPDKSDNLANHIYSNNPTGQFGSAVFEKVLLQCKADIVLSCMDHWMIEYIEKSPFRKYFKWIIMPTIDSRPQKEEWLGTYQSADLVLGYAKYAKDVLEEESGGQIQVKEIVRPGADTEVFKPLDRIAVRKELGVPINAKILLTVMRNQRRKLYPDLIEGFGGYLEYCNKIGNQDLFQNSYLYLHTSYPDVGFDIPKHVLKNKIGHRVLVTYKCNACDYYWSDFIQSELTTCKRCGNLAATMPSSSNGLKTEDLVKIYNLADLYIQYSIAESLAVPIAEAKSCGIPVYSIDYAAMSEQVEVEGCKKIKVGKLFHEPIIETEQIRALPDTHDTIKKLYHYFSYDIKNFTRYSSIARQDVIDNYSFDRAAKIFEKAIDNLEIYDREETWYSDKKLLKNNLRPPQVRSNSDFIDWCLDTIIKKPELKNTYWKYQMAKGLNVGYILDRGGRQKFDHDIALKTFNNMVQLNNYWENERINNIKPAEDVVKWKLV
jgi:glycosyltransferase involved in cell wall biosynthesis